MRPSRVTLGVLLAVLGLCVAAGITYAASSLVSQPIGLSDQPRDLGASLAPARTARPRATTKLPARVVHRRTKAKRHAVPSAQGAPAAIVPSAPAQAPAPAVTTTHQAAATSPAPTPSGTRTTQPRTSTSSSGSDDSSGSGSSADDRHDTQTAPVPTTSGGTHDGDSDYDD